MTGRRLTIGRREGKAIGTSPEAIEISLQALGHCGDFGALAHYADPAYYTHCYRSRKHDVEYYARLARLIPGRVLEYGCGNGRVTLAVAETGSHVWGVDWSRPMLNDFEQRLEKVDTTIREHIVLIHGDMREVELSERFALVIAPFNVLMHLYARADIEQFLAKVKAHLLPGGRFVCDVSVPQPADLARKPEKRYRAPRFRHPETLQWIGYSERFEYDPLRQLLLVWMEFVPEDGSEPWVIPLTHRQYFPCELEAHFHHAGFSSVTYAADFSDNPPDAYTDSLMITCQV